MFPSNLEFLDKPVCSIYRNVLLMASLVQSISYKLKKVFNKEFIEFFSCIKSKVLICFFFAEEIR